MKQGVSTLPTVWHRIRLTLFLSNGLSVALYLLRVISTGTERYNFMVWNLVLAWLPLLFSIVLVKRLQTESWHRWQNIVLTFLWLGFLPNSFYLITDLVHLQTIGEINVMFDTVMILSFIVNGLIVGFASLYQVHRQLLKRLSIRRAHALITLIIVAVSFAIYLGRVLRWNSWDVLLNPAGILFDVSDRLIHPITYPETFLSTTTFSLLIGVMYVLVYQVADMYYGSTEHAKK